MLKKVLFTFLTLLVIYSSCVIAYRIFEPRDNYAVDQTTSYVAYDSLKPYIENSSQNTHYLFFYSSINNNSVYLKDTIFSQVEQNTGKSLSSLFEFVDITEIDRNLETKKLSDDWQVSAFPALVAVTKEDDGTLTIKNKLEWTNDSPLTAQSVEDWLILNDLYKK